MAWQAERRLNFSSRWSLDWVPLFSDQPVQPYTAAWGLRGPTEIRTMSAISNVDRTGVQCCVLGLYYLTGSRFSPPCLAPTTLPTLKLTADRAGAVSATEPPLRRQTDVTRWKVSTTEKPGASRKWASPSEEETELNHKEKGRG